MKEELLNYPNVVGVGVGYKVSRGETLAEEATIVLVERKLPMEALTAADMLPAIFENRRTDVVEVGFVRALSPTDRWRPAFPGISIGHYKVTAGTFGAVVLDRETRKQLILSNNHVLANSNDAEIGDMILQPGAADGGTYPLDLIGALLAFEPIIFNEQPGDCGIADFVAGALNAAAQISRSSHRVVTTKTQQATNLIDAAIALPSDPEDIQTGIYNIGKSVGMIEDPPLGLKVTKSGRTTGVTEGKLLAKEVTISVSYGAGRMATFTDQYMFEPILQGGDSGSLIVAKMQTFPAVALAYAGSDQVAFGNPIVPVLDMMGVDLVNPN